jgi:formylglycine-generating enzyme required for sulfatase activity
MTECTANNEDDPSPSACWLSALSGHALTASIVLPLVFGIASALAEPLTATEERGLKPKDSFKECDGCPEMVVLPAGSFTMGSPANWEDRQEREREGPQHSVTFARQFAVGKFAVTFDEWDACVADGGCDGYRPSDEGWGRDRRPVINVSWNDAKAYVEWLSHKTGKNYRLLSEAEREYVTRAGTSTPFWWGSSILPQQANYDSKWGYRERTVPVDTFQANPWGLYQVHGNVSDWTEDCWNASYSGAPTDGSAWTSGDCTIRVFRGGSWFSSATTLRAAYRNGNFTVVRNSYFGFRVARTITP